MEEATQLCALLPAEGVREGMVATSAVCAQLWRGLRRKPIACPQPG
ncbi:hypothetical protein [uncultured Porphyromonas sp.]|nr:hypothetical protein [uncultured Porphyromonas sp.]